MSDEVRRARVVSYAFLYTTLAPFLKFSFWDSLIEIEAAEKTVFQNVLRVRFLL